MSIVRLLRTSAFFLASMAIVPRCGAQELRLYAEAGGGPSLGSFADVSPAAYGAALGLEAAGLFGSGLGLALELGYESFPPEADWIDFLGRFRALALGGWRIALGRSFGLTPRAGFGLGYAFGSASFSAGDYESLSAYQALAQAGLSMDWSPSGPLSLRASLDYGASFEDGACQTGLRAGAGLGIRLAGGEGAPRKPSERRLAAERRDELSRLAQSLAADLAAYPSIRVLREERGLRLVLERSFDADSSSLGEVMKAQLAALLASAGKLRPLRVLIRGYAAKDGKEATDLPISQARAEAVKAWLVRAKAFPGAEFEALAMGCEAPVGDNATAEGRSRNRRVELELLLYENDKE